MFEWIILLCVQRLKGERTISGIFNLLTGKRSSQTLQDARGYKLDSFFGIYKSLNRKRFDDVVKVLEDKNQIFIQSGSFPILTQAGENTLKIYNGPNLNYFNGMKDHQLVDEFEKRVVLLIQTWTSVEKGQNGFIPIVDDPKVQRWVKQTFMQTKNSKAAYITSMYNEIHKLLKERSTIEAELFAFRMTGAGIIGMTREQLGQRYNLTVEDVEVGLKHVFHYIYQIVNENPRPFPTLHRCAEGLDSQSLITESAKRTYYYIQKGWTIDAITKKRRLKRSTIQDHIVEAALVIPNFPIISFLSRDDQFRIVSKAEELKTQRLKLINEALEGHYSYFQIRLALAKHQIHSEKGSPYANA